MTDSEIRDCFLSHNSKDKPAVRMLADELRAARLTVWLDEEQLRPGIPWQPLLEAGIRASRSVAVLVGADGLGPWEDQETQAALVLAVQDGRPVIPVLLPDAPAVPILPLFLTMRTWVDLRRTSEGRQAGLDRLIWGITGTQLRPDARPEVSNWPQTVADSPLWPLLADEPHGLRDQVLSICREAEDLCQRAAKVLPDQRWRDPHAPSRVIRRLAQLLGDGVAESLSPADAAIAIAVPHIYEAVLAAAELALADQADPLDPAALAHANGRLARALRECYASETAWARRRNLLVQRGLSAATRDLAAWQLTSFLHQSGEVWDWAAGGREDPGLVAMHTALAKVLAPAALQSVSADPRIPQLLSGPRLVALARLLFADYDEIEQQRSPDHHAHPLESLRFYGEGPRTWRLEELKLAHLLNLAAGMALDSRRLSVLIPEHLGLAAEIDPERMRKTLAQCAWHPDGKGLTLTLDCPHEAIDAALRAQIRNLDVHLRRLDQDESIAADQRSRLPRFLSDRRLEPERIDGQPRYRRDHLSFSLDQGRVRELLMGEALYGKPELALRELYQNALDACRYRRARESYLRAIGKLGDSTAPYQGIIEFRAGQDDEGRAYIECCDNGIGMAEKPHLRTLFAKAGQRFADSHAFHLELADWEAAGVHFYPNSRFGIGVFSYFMLADEILIESQRLNDNGISRDEGFRARVVGSGSLFRIQRLPSGEPCDGTRIRLYTNDCIYTSNHGFIPSDLAENVVRNPDPHRAILETVSEWLWIPEFETRVFGQTEHRLLAAKPTPRMTQTCGALIPIPESHGESGRCRAWWGGKLIENAVRDPFVSHNDDPRGVVLCDGIVVDLRSGHQGSAGIVVNLIEDLRPDLSADRGRIANWRHHHEWLPKLLESSGWRQLTEIPGIRLDVLGRLVEHQRTPLARLDLALRRGELKSPGTQWGKAATHVSAQSLGLCEIDRALVGPANSHQRSYLFGPFHSNSDVAARWARGRLCALRKAGATLSHSLALLAEYDTASAFIDAPVAAWDMLRSAGQQPSTLAVLGARWSLTFGELADLACTLADLSVQARYLGDLPRDEKLDARQVRLLSHALNGKEPWVQAISLAHLMQAAEAWSMSLPDIAHLAIPLWKLGAVLPDLHTIALSPALTTRQRQLLSWDLSAKGHIMGELSLGHLLYAAQEWNLSSTDITDLMQPLRDLGVATPTIDGIDFGVRLGEMQKKLLSERMDDSRPWLASFCIARLARAAHKLKLKPREIIELVRPLADIGIPMPDLAGFGSVDDLNDRQVALLSKNLMDTLNPWLAWEPVGDTLTLLHLLRAASRWSITIGEIIELAKPLGDLGILLPDMHKLPKDLRVDARQLQLLSSDLDSKNASLMPVTTGRIVKAALTWGMPLKNVVQLARPLEHLVQLPNLDRLPAHHGLEGKSLELLSIHLTGSNPWMDSIPVSHLAKAVAHWKLPLERILAFTQPFADLGIGVEKIPSVVKSSLQSSAVIHLLFELGPIVWPDKGALNAWELALRCAEMHGDPGEYAEALRALGGCGLDVTDALAFADFCASRIRRKS